VEVVQDHFRDQLSAGDGACKLYTPREDEAQHEGIHAAGDSHVTRGSVRKRLVSSKLPASAWIFSQSSLRLIFMCRMAMARSGQYQDNGSD
jgi:hypothetical protein